jgi:hypothetical protein
MDEEVLIETPELYDLIIRDIGRDYPGFVSVLDNLIQTLREAVQDQYMEAQAMYDEMYGWETSPEPFEEWLDHEFPQLAMLPAWIFSREVEDGS